MLWDKKVIDLADEIELHVQQGRTQEALASFKNLREITGIDPSPPYVPPPSPGPYFGTGALPDEDW